MNSHKICRLGTRVIDMLNFGPRRNRKGIARGPPNNLFLAAGRGDYGVSTTLVAVIDERARVLRHDRLNVAVQPLCLDSNRGG